MADIRIETDSMGRVEIAKFTDLPFLSAPNKFAVQGAHDALVQFSGTLRRWRLRSTKSPTTFA